MSQAFNLSQLANNVNSAGQLNGASVTGSVPSASSLATNNYSIVESGGNLVIYFGLTAILTINSTGQIINNLSIGGNVTVTGNVTTTGDITATGNVTAYGS